MTNRSSRDLLLSAVLLGMSGCSGDGPVAAPSRLGPSAPVFEVAYRPPMVLTTSLPGGQVGQPYGTLNLSTTGLVAGGGMRPFTWTLTGGTLPPGLTLNPTTGFISGTPTMKGTFAGLVFTVTDAKGNTSTSRPLSIEIDDPHFFINILGPREQVVPGANARSGPASTITLRFCYTRNGTRMEKSVTLSVPANATPAAILTAFMPTLTAAIGADFDLTLITGAATPRIEVIAKAGVTLGSCRPVFGSGANATHVVPSGTLRIGTDVSP